MSPGRRRRDATDPQLADDVIVWRTRKLTAAGFHREAAGSLASDARFDLHELLDLIDRGCPPDLALRIVAPLNWMDGQDVD